MTQCFGELFAVKARNISVKFEAGRIPDFPARMFYAIFAATVPHTGVAPVMFGNKFGMRTGGNRLRFAGCAHLEKFPLLSASPAVLDAQFSIDVLYIVLHRESEVALSIKCTGNEGNRTAWHKLADENYTTSPGVSRLSSHVETQIHFFEIAMQRDRETEKTCIEKKESDNADERLAVFIIDLRPGRNERFNQSRIDDVIQQRQITPVSGKKWFHGRVRRSQTSVYGINHSLGGLDSGAPFAQAQKPD